MLMRVLSREGCSRSFLRLGGVKLSTEFSRVLVKVLARVLRMMFAIGRCQVAFGIMFAFGLCQSRVLSRGAVEGCCPGYSGSCLPWWCQAELSWVLRMVCAIGRCQGAVEGAVQGGVRGAVQGASDHVCD